MTGGPLLLTLAYVLLGVLLLSLNLRSGWRWPVKAAVIASSGVFAIAFFLGLVEMLGWPTERALPERFTLHASLVQEPSKTTAGSGAIYLWLSPIEETEAAAVEAMPRAHRLPYDRELHEQLARAEAELRTGRLIQGRATSERLSGTTASQQIELFEAPPVPLPGKSVG